MRNTLCVGNCVNAKCFVCRIDKKQNSEIVAHQQVGLKFQKYHRHEASMHVDKEVFASSLLLYPKKELC